MNDFVLKYLFKRLKIVTKIEKKIEIKFLDKHGAGITEKDEFYKLILTDEEGRDFSKV